MHLRIVVLLGGTQFTLMNIIVSNSLLILLSDCIKPEGGGKKEATRHEIQSKCSHASLRHGVHFICKIILMPTTATLVKLK